MDAESTLAAEDTRADETSARRAWAHACDLAVGESVARYVVLARIGTGGMGVVYAAYDPQLDRKIALKLLRPRIARERLLREAQAMAKLSHPNVVTIHDVGEHRGTIFLALELVEGDTLRVWLEKKERSWREILNVLLSAGEGLAAAHAAGIVHRDFKPDNVLVGSDGLVRVTDFGLALAANDSMDSAGASSSILDSLQSRYEGTPAYMAPEQHAGELGDVRADQFAFCVTSYEALFGTRPFVGQTAVEIVASLSDGRIQPPSTRHRVPVRVRRAIERGLADAPERRWPDMVALLRALRRDPTAKNRKLAVAALAIVAVGGAVAWQDIERSRAMLACRQQARTIEDVWGDDVRTRVQEAWSEADARGAFDRAARHLDAYAEEWIGLHERACLASDVEGSQSPGHRAQVHECLDRRLARLGALVDVLGEADPRARASAVTAVHGMPPLATCADQTRLVLSTRTLVDELHRTSAIAVRRELAAIAGLIAADHHEDAMPRVSAMVSTAEAIDNDVLVAEANHALGRLQGRRGDYPAARRTLEAAYYRALSAGGDEAALDIATELTFLVGYTMTDAPAGLAWGRTAQALVERLGREDSLLHALVYNQIGSVYRTAGDPEQSIASNRQALAIRERVVGPDHVLVATSLNNLANALSDLGKHDDAIPLHERALAIRERVYGPDHTEVAQSLVNLGIEHAILGQYTDAAAAVERALAIHERTMGPQHPWVADALSNLGVLYQQTDRPDLALEHHRRALEIRLAAGRDTLDLAESYLNIGGILGGLRQWPAAVEHSARGLAIAQAIYDDEHPKIALFASALGRAQLGAGDLAAARAQIERALAIREKVYGADTPFVAEMLIDLGEVDLAAKAFATALDRFEHAERILDAHRDAPAHLRGRLQRGLTRVRASIGTGRRSGGPARPQAGDDGSG